MTTPREMIARAQEAFRTLVQPSLVAIYASHKNRPGTPQQVATGFMVEYGGRPVLVTAKHSLRGTDFDQNPAEKALHIDGRWVYVDGRELVEIKERDIALAHFDEFPLNRCLPQASLDETPPPCLIAMGGFLVRNFRRHNGQLSPAPRSYINSALPVEEGLVRMQYPKRRNVTVTSEAVVNSRPEGLSGGPMLDALALADQQVRLTGVFTEQDNGIASGEHVHFVREAMKCL